MSWAVAFSFLMLTVGSGSLCADRMVRKALSMLAYIGLFIHYRICDILLQLYRCQQGYRWNTVSPSCTEVVIKLEGVRKRFTNMLLGLEGMRYKGRLDKLGLMGPP